MNPHLWECSAVRDRKRSRFVNKSAQVMQKQAHKKSLEIQRSSGHNRKVSRRLDSSLRLRYTWVLCWEKRCVISCCFLHVAGVILYATSPSPSTEVLLIFCLRTEQATLGVKSACTLEIVWDLNGLGFDTMKNIDKSLSSQILAEQNKHRRGRSDRSLDSRAYGCCATLLLQPQWRCH